MTRFMRWAASAAAASSTTTRSCGAGRWRSSRTSGRASGSSAGCARSQPYERVLAVARMPGARWFDGRGAQLRREHARAAAHERRAAARDRADAVAVLHCSELRELDELTWGELSDAGRAPSPAACARSASARGDRVVAYMPNIPETLIAFLATASIGAIWSSAAPEFGARSVIDRFAQIEPKVLLAVDGYRHGGKDFDRTARRAGHPRRAADASSTPCCCRTSPTERRRRARGRRAGVLAGASCSQRGEGAELVVRAGALRPPAVGALLLRHDRPAEGDRAGPRRHPARAAEEAPAPGPAPGRPHVLVHDDRLDDVELPRRLPAHRRGDRALRRQPRRTPTSARCGAWPSAPASPAWASAPGCSRAARRPAIEPGRDHDLSALRAIGSTGSPLAPESFQWVYEHVGPDIWLFSTSGGTDVCTAFVGGCPLLPVYEGELQCRALGCAVESWDEQGNAHVDEVGELVITEPMPSMPLFFWGDEDGERLRESYFAMYPGVWRHGDWIRITPRGGAVIYGRSDSTINRQGVRMGTSEIYRAAGARAGGARRARRRRPGAPGRGRAVDDAVRRARAGRRRSTSELTRADQAPHPRGLLAAARAQRGPPDRRGAAHAVGQGARGARQADPDGHARAARRRASTRSPTRARSTTSSSSRASSSSRRRDPPGARRLRARPRRALRRLRGRRRRRRQSPSERPTISFMISFAPP